MHNIPAFRVPRNILLLSTLCLSLLLGPVQAQALGNGESLPDFGDFSKSVQNNQAGILRGVYVPGVLAFPVVQQPVGQAIYVSLTDGEVTQFGMPSQFGNIGLLAHNNLSGRYFSQLAAGQEVRLVYGDGEVEYFVITQILQFQALSPTNPYGSFRDLNTRELLTAAQLFDKVYRGGYHVTFQTCIAANGEPSWGRLFVIATPKTSDPEPYYLGWQLPR